MKFPEFVKVYGDQSFRGDCPVESAEQKTMFSAIRRIYPDTLGIIALHPRNEGKRTKGQIWYEKAEGLTAGAADLIIPGNPAMVLELKRQDHTKSKWETDQLKYLEASHRAGAFVCVALGWEAALQAVKDYVDSLPL